MTESTEIDLSSAGHLLDEAAKKSLRGAVRGMFALMALGAGAAYGQSCSTAGCGVTSYYPPPSNPPYSTSGGGYGTGGSGGGGEGGSTSPTYPTETVAATNPKAYSLKCKIKSHSGLPNSSTPNFNNTEYLGFVYFDNTGNLAASNVIQGSGTSVNVPTALSQLGIQVSQVVAMVHNHDVYTYCTQKGYGLGTVLCNEQDAPSGGTAGSDWAIYQNFLWNDPGRIDGIGQYIVGPDGILRYFSPNNQHAPPSTSTPAGTQVSGTPSC